MRTPSTALSAVATDPPGDLELAPLDGEARTLDGRTIAVRASSLCVHGDNPRAPELLQALRDALADRGVQVAPFAA